MVKKVRWTKRARDNYENLNEYLLTNWSKKIADDVNLKIKRKISFLKRFPNAGFDLRGPRAFKKFVLSSHNSIIYRIKVDEIIILNIFDNRQSPQKQ